MVFNATLNTVSVISWQSVLLVEETGVPGENLFNDENILKKNISLLQIMILIFN
jgi:hypothetical protein